AVARLYAVKGRDADRALPLIAADPAQIAACLGPLPAMAARIASHFWPGPVTLAIAAPPALPREVTGRRPTIGVRVPGAPIRPARTERAALVGLIAGHARRLEAERSLDELTGLAEAAGAEVVLRVLQERPKPDPSTFLGAGKIAMLAASCAEAAVDLVVVDNE